MDIHGRYVSLADAVHAQGLRLVVTAGIPGPWVEAAKSILWVKRIDHLRVHHQAGAVNAPLTEWTGANSAPVAIFEDEPPRAGWAEILALAERIAPLPALIPADERDRATMFGLAHALCGEDGFGWNKRLLFFARAEVAMAAAPDEAREGFDRMRRKYGAGDAYRAHGRVLSVLGLLTDRLREQMARGSRYLVGDTLTAADIYCACFMAMVRPLPQDHCRLDDAMRATYTEHDPALVEAAADLLAFRDRIYADHLELPMRL
ncbi:hypothetical protein K663_18176 [Sphingobium sp. MI1205]|nr:hypothetical protein K663_18176 [Sphingobium sp. MI1205]